MKISSTSAISRKQLVVETRRVNSVILSCSSRVLFVKGLNDFRSNDNLLHAYNFLKIFSQLSITYFICHHWMTRFIMSHSIVSCKISDIVGNPNFDSQNLCLFKKCESMMDPIKTAIGNFPCAKLICPITA